VGAVHAANGRDAGVVGAAVAVVAVRRRTAHASAVGAGVARSARIAVVAGRPGEWIVHKDATGTRIAVVPRAGVAVVPRFDGPATPDARAEERRKGRVSTSDGSLATTAHALL